MELKRLWAKTPGSKKQVAGLALNHVRAIDWRQGCRIAFSPYPREMKIGSRRKECFAPLFGTPTEKKSVRQHENFQFLMTKRRPQAHFFGRKYVFRFSASNCIFPSSKQHQVTFTRVLKSLGIISDVFPKDMKNLNFHLKWSIFWPPFSTSPGVNAGRWARDSP